MHSRIYRLIQLLIVAAALAVPTIAQGDSVTPCQKPCTAELIASSKEKHWRTPQRFGKVEVLISVFSDEERVHRRLTDGGCGAIYRGHGVLVRIKVCGSGSVPIRVTYRATGDIPRSLLVAYSAQV